MTTQVPHEPPQYGGYPTAPPWATTAPATASETGQPSGFPPMPDLPTTPGAPPQPFGRPDARPGAAPVPHGGLMVLHPELMRDAARPRPPSWIPVAVVTFFLGPFGAISAARRAKRAAVAGNGKHPYWIAFGATMVVSAALTVVMAFAALVPLYLVVRENAVEKAVESSIVQDNPAGGPAATAADCTPTGERGADGLRPYSCTVTLADGRTAELGVVADGQGNGRLVG